MSGVAADGLRFACTRATSMEPPVVTPRDTTLGRIRVTKVPPSDFLEGVDLRSYHFVKGREYTVSREVAAVLMVWGYAVDSPAD
jgi:hypothetical protein